MIRSGRGFQSRGRGREPNIISCKQEKKINLLPYNKPDKAGGSTQTEGGGKKKKRRLNSEGG